MIPIPETLSLQGRRVLVTGAASGIGKATATVLHQMGASLIATDRSPLTELQAALGCEVVEGDLTDDAFLASLLAGERLHAVAHCAGILEGRPWQEDRHWQERFHRVMDINIRVPLQLGSAAIDHMAQHGGGSLVLV